MSNRIRRFWEQEGNAEVRDGKSSEAADGTRSVPSTLGARGRGPREPSARNKAVHHAVRAQGFTQEEVALEFGISQTRVSQIVRQADRWFATPQSIGKDIPTSEGRKRLAAHVDLARLDTIYTLAMRDHQRAQQQHCTRKSGTNGGRYYSETVHRDPLVTSQPLRTALRALELMWRLDERNAKGGRKSVSPQKNNSPEGGALALEDEPLTGAGETTSVDDRGCKCGAELAAG
jgi:predicted transcriptional regulator